MLSSKKIVVIATLVLVFLVYAMPSQGATFRNRTISDQQFLELCRNGDANGVTRALNAGLSANVKDKDGRSALMYAAAYGNVETVNVLLKAGADVAYYGGSALMHAAVHGKVDNIDALLKAGADVQAKNNSGATACMLAARNGHALAVNMLLKAGSDVNAKDNNGWTALMYASANGYLETVRALLQAGADVNVQNIRDNSGDTAMGGRTALMMAARNGHKHIVEALIDAGADDKSDNKGRSALMHAAEAADGETVNALIVAGSYVNQEDSDGRTALDYARKNPKIMDTPLLHRLEELRK